MTPLLQFTDRGIYCPRADCYIDPRRSVDRAIITHAHSDHARRGSKNYLAERMTAALLHHRLGKKISTQAVEYGERIVINGVRFSLHPAGHVIGSAQVRVEYGGEVWVVSGDYKLEPDPLAGTFEPIRCHVFCTESTFGLPVYRWGNSNQVIRDINNWWCTNKENGIASVLLAYSLGKAQRLLHDLDTAIGPICVHRSIAQVNALLRERGVNIPTTKVVAESMPESEMAEALIIVPPNSMKNGTLNQLPAYSVAYASGWVATRDLAWSRSADTGFVISDHADWDGLNEAVRLSEAHTVYVTHGFTKQFSRWLSGQGLTAYPADV